MDSTQLSPNKIVHSATYSDAVNYFRTMLEFLNIFLLLTLWIGDAALILGELELNEIPNWETGSLPTRCKHLNPQIHE